MKNWLSDIDKQLLQIRNQYGNTYYQGFKTGKLDSALLEELAEKQTEVLADTGIVDKLNQILSEEDSGAEEAIQILRKSILLRRVIDGVRVEKHPALVSLKGKIQLQENEFIPSFGGEQNGYSARRSILSESDDMECRRNAFLSLQPLLNNISDICYELIEVANVASSDSGYTSYFDFLLAQEDMTNDQLESAMVSALHATEDSYLEFLAIGREMLKSERINLFDLPFIQGELTRETDKLFSKRNRFTDLRETLNSIGIDLSEFPVTIETVDSPNAGTCFVLGSRDIRLILGLEGGYFGHYVAFHEFGHALHYSMQPDSAILSDQGVCLETMADFFATLLSDPDWLSEHTLMTAQEVQKFLRMKKLSDSYRIRTMIRDTMFESEIFRNPGKSFDEVWLNLTEKILGVQAKEAIWSPFSIYRPAYSKNYVFSHFLSKSLTELTSMKKDSSSENTKRLFSLFNDLVRQGNLEPFEDRAVKLGIDYCALGTDINL